MPYYEFCLIGGDGARLRRERHLASDLETLWGLVFRMAEFESERGRRIHVLDDQGRIVIGIGASAATLSANILECSGAAPPAHDAKAACVLIGVVGGPCGRQSGTGLVG